ncbi:MAG: hypothetical protein ACO3YY_10810 [Phycisphaerales bacterium]|jgi:hypothetical protein
MDKKSKKRLEVLRDRLQQRRTVLSNARRQDDDPAETRRLEDEVAALEAEIAKLKNS